MPKSPYQDLPCGITTVDTGFRRPRFDASHLLVEGDQAAFIDVGTTHSCGRLLDALHAKGLPRENVAYVIVTHVHLDHAGGAGALLRQLPNARLVVHPRGARHMINPTKLISSATAVYGNAELRKSYGEIIPVPTARVIEAGDGLSLSLNGRELLFLDTPGHARHHFCIVDSKSRGIFTGDAFGISFREFDTPKGTVIFPTTSPVQFDPAAMHASIDRLMGYDPQYMYLTHYGPVTTPARLAADLHKYIDALTAMTEAFADRGDQRHRLLMKGMTEMLLTALRENGCRMDEKQSLDLWIKDLELNAQGLAMWIDKKQQQ